MLAMAEPERVVGVGGELHTFEQVTGVGTTIHPVAACNTDVADRDANHVVDVVGRKSPLGDLVGGDEGDGWGGAQLRGRRWQLAVGVSTVTRRTRIAAGTSKASLAYANARNSNST